MASRFGKCIRFSEADVPPHRPHGTGVRAMMLEPEDEVVSLEKIASGQQVLTISELGMGKRTDECDYRCQNRGGKGVAAMMLTDRTGNLCALHVINGDEDVMLICDDGTIIRMATEEISLITRHTQGVKLMRVADGVKVVSACIVPHEEEQEEEGAPESAASDSEE